MNLHPSLHMPEVRYRRNQATSANIIFWIVFASGQVVMFCGCWGVLPYVRSPYVALTCSIASVGLYLFARSLHVWALQNEQWIATDQKFSTAYETASIHNSYFPPDSAAATAEEPEALKFHHPNDLIDEAVGFIVAGNSGSGKTSVACWLAGLLTSREPAQVLSLDPHANELWEQLGIATLSRIGEIEQAVNWLIQELELRFELRRQRKPVGEPLIIFTDEINSCLSQFTDPEMLREALERLGSEGRKVGLSLIAINQSSNVKAIGIDGNMRNNYCLLLLGAAARSFAKTEWKKTDPEYEWIKDRAYPALVTGSVPTELFYHPTHHAYPTYKKVGNPPMNLLPINQLPCRALVLMQSNYHEVAPGIKVDLPGILVYEVASQRTPLQDSSSITVEPQRNETRLPDFDEPEDEPFSADISTDNEMIARLNRLLKDSTGDRPTSPEIPQSSQGGGELFDLYRAYRVAREDRVAPSKFIDSPEYPLAGGGSFQRSKNQLLQAIDAYLDVWVTDLFSGGMKGAHTIVKFIWNRRKNHDGAEGDAPYSELHTKVSTIIARLRSE